MNTLRLYSQNENMSIMFCLISLCYILTLLMNVAADSYMCIISFRHKTLCIGNKSHHTCQRFYQVIDLHHRDIMHIHDSFFAVRATSTSWILWKYPAPSIYLLWWHNWNQIQVWWHWVWIWLQVGIFIAKYDDSIFKTWFMMRWFTIKGWGIRRSTFLGGFEIGNHMCAQGFKC